MAESEWTDCTGTGLGTGDVLRGVSSAYTKAHGTAETYVFGFRSITSTIGFAGKYCNLADFGPITAMKGASLRFLVKRYAAGVNYAPFMGIFTGTDPSTANGYRLGLSAASAYQFVLEKGTPGANLLASNANALRSSTATYTGVGDAAAYWYHLRLDVLVNPHGDVVLTVKKNDVQTNGVVAPVWQDIAGMASYTDDSFGGLTGSAPYTGPFYAIFGMYTQGSGSIALFDHIEIWRQTNP